MSVRVNFVPLGRLMDHQRRRRGGRWMAANLAALLTLVVVWGVERTAERGLTRLGTGLQSLEQQRAEVARRRALVDVKERLISERMELLAGMERSHRWPARLLGLAELASDEIALSSLQISPAASAAPPPAPPPTGRPAPGATSRPTTQPAAPPAPAASVRVLRLVGQAVDHEALMRILAALRVLDGAADARLVHATRDVGREHGLLNFELECRIEEAPR